VNPTFIDARVLFRPESSGQRFLPEGPPQSPRATCPLLIRSGGAMKLVITTAVEHMPAEQQAIHTNAGCLFIADTPF
jgi:hypothetical protein